MKNVKIYLISGDGEKQITEVKTSVWLKKVGMRRCDGSYILNLDVVQVEMPDNIGYEFIEDLTLLLSHKERKKLGEVLLASV